MEPADLAECSNDDLVQAIGQLHAAELAIRATLLEVVGAYDGRKAWREDGATSMTSWLAMRLGMSHRSASEIARVARSLPELPAVAGVFAEGGLSWDQVAAVTRLAGPEDDEALAAEAPAMSAAQLQAAARRIRPPEPEVRRRCLKIRPQLDSGWVRLSGQLPADDGAVVATALERIASQAPPDPVGGLPEPLESRMADALVELASVRLAADADADRACVVVHVDADVLAGAEGGADVVDAPPIVAEAARRLACDARVEFVAHAADGKVVGVGRTSRQVPAWLTRHLRRRDGGCRFPGCGRTRWTHSHHVRHWIDGGPTDSDNLLTLCGHHHRLLHEGGWRLSGHPDDHVRFTRPDGRSLPDSPPRLQGGVAARLRI